MQTPLHPVNCQILVGLWSWILNQQRGTFFDLSQLFASLEQAQSDLQNETVSLSDVLALEVIEGNCSSTCELLIRPKVDLGR